MLLAVAVFPPGGKKREGGKGDEEPRGNRVGHWTAKRDGCQTGDTAQRVKLARLPFMLPLKGSLTTIVS